MASSAASPKDSEALAAPANGEHVQAKDENDDFSSKAAIMTLMTTDVDRVSEFSWHLFSLVGKTSQVFVLQRWIDHL